MNRLPTWPSLRQSLYVRFQHLKRSNATQNLTKARCRYQSTKTSEPTRSNAATNTTTTRNTPPTQPTALTRLISRTPTKFLRTRLSALHSAPLTTITSFLLLHEITAIIPLFGLASAFHYYQWLPPYFAEGAWVLKGVNMFGNYFRRKGWIDDHEAREAKVLAEEGRGEEVEEGQKKSGMLGKWWGRGEGGTRIVIEFATAYAIVKALMPVRIVVSVWGAPWFARWTVIPVQNGIRRWWAASKKS